MGGWSDELIYFAPPEFRMYTYSSMGGIWTGWHQTRLEARLEDGCRLVPSHWQRS